MYNRSYLVHKSLKYLLSCPSRSLLTSALNNDEFISSGKGRFLRRREREDLRAQGISFPPTEGLWAPGRHTTQLSLHKKTCFLKEFRYHLWLLQDLVQFLGWGHDLPGHGFQNMSPHNMPFWQMDYFELTAIENAGNALRRAHVFLL